MSLFYRILYQVGFTPWEDGLTQESVAAQIALMFDREERERETPGRALDLGCGSGIHAVELARRGWQVSGIDLVGRALSRARKRAAQAGVEVNLIHGDVTALRATGIGEDFQLVLDFGTVHGLSKSQREKVGEEVTAVTSPGATMLTLAFEPGRRGLLPGGLSAADIAATYADWAIIDEFAQDAELPPFLQRTGANPRWYRLRRE